MGSSSGEQGASPVRSFKELLGPGRGGRFKVELEELLERPAGALVVWGPILSGRGERALEEEREGARDRSQSRELRERDPIVEAAEVSPNPSPRARE